MVKVTGLGQLAQIIEEEEIIRKHERRAKRQLIKNRVAELMACGVDKMTAEIMAKVEWDYEL